MILAHVILRNRTIRVVHKVLVRELKATLSECKLFVSLLPTRINFTQYTFTAQPNPA